jgi:Response regulator receiver domain
MASSGRSSSIKSGRTLREAAMRLVVLVALAVILQPSLIAQARQNSSTVQPDGVVRYDKASSGWWQALTDKWGWVVNSRPFNKSVPETHYPLIMMRRGFSGRKKKMKVFIVDDSKAVVERLADLLTDVVGVDVIGEASNPLEAIDCIQQTRPDAVILDLQMVVAPCSGSQRRPSFCPA